MNRPKCEVSHKSEEVKELRAQRTSGEKPGFMKDSLRIGIYEMGTKIPEDKDKTNSLC